MCRSSVQFRGWLTGDMSNVWKKWGIGLTCNVKRLRPASARRSRRAQRHVHANDIQIIALCFGCPHALGWYCGRWLCLNLDLNQNIPAPHDFKLYVCNAVSATCMRCHYDVTKQVKKSIVASKDWYLFFTVKIVVHNNMTGLAIHLTNLDNRRFGVSENMIQEYCKYWKI